jgi:hypothetical protein
MEVCRGSGTQYGESEKFVILFSSKCGDTSLQFSADDCNRRMTTVIICSYELFKSSVNLVTDPNPICFESWTQRDAMTRVARHPSPL